MNGEAIFYTRPWVRFGCPAAHCGVEVRYTLKGNDTVYAIVLGPPPAPVITFPDATAPPGLQVSVLGHPGSLAWRQVGSSIEVTLPELPPSEAHTLKFFAPRVP